MSATRCIIGGVTMLAITNEAAAHTSFEGSEGLYRGLLHPIAEPLQGLLAAAFGLVLARSKSENASRALAIAAIAGITAALVKAVAWADAAVIMLGLAGATLTCGLTLAAFRRVPRALGVGLAILAGLVLGANAVSEGEVGRLATSIGSLVGGALLIIYLSGLGHWLAKRETQYRFSYLVPQIAGAWIAAIAIMIIAFEFVRTGS